MGTTNYNDENSKEKILDEEAILRQEAQTVDYSNGFNDDDDDDEDIDDIDLECVDEFEDTKDGSDSKRNNEDRKNDKKSSRDKRSRVDDRYSRNGRTTDLPGRIREPSRRHSDRESRRSDASSSRKDRHSTDKRLSDRDRGDSRRDRKRHHDSRERRDEKTPRLSNENARGVKDDKKKELSKKEPKQNSSEAQKITIDDELDFDDDGFMEFDDEIDIEKMKEAAQISSPVPSTGSAADAERKDDHSEDIENSKPKEVVIERSEPVERKDNTTEYADKEAKRDDSQKPENKSVSKKDRRDEKSVKKVDNKRKTEKTDVKSNSSTKEEIRKESRNHSATSRDRRSPVDSKGRIKSPSPRGIAPAERVDRAKIMPPSPRRDHRGPLRRHDVRSHPRAPRPVGRGQRMVQSYLPKRDIPSLLSMRIDRSPDISRHSRRIEMDSRIEAERSLNVRQFNADEERRRPDRVRVAREFSPVHHYNHNQSRGVNGSVRHDMEDSRLKRPIFERRPIREERRDVKIDRRFSNPSIPKVKRDYRVVESYKNGVNHHH